VSICTGYHRTPVVPKFYEQHKFSGEILHSYHYRNGKRFAGKKILLIGNGNSAFEISLDLVDHGASLVRMLSNTPRHVVLLSAIERLFKAFRFFGLLNASRAEKLHKIKKGSKEWNSEIEKRDSLMKYFQQDLTEFGFSPPPKNGFNDEQLNHGRIAVTDEGTVDAIKKRKMAILKGKIHRFVKNGVEIVTEDEVGVHKRKKEFVEVDTVILCTGFKPRLEEFLSDKLLEVPEGMRVTHPVPHVSEDGFTSSVWPSISFAGFNVDLNGGLGWGLWGWDIGKSIAQKLGTFTEGAIILPSRPSERSPFSTLSLKILFVTTILVTAYIVFAFLQ